MQRARETGSGGKNRGPCGASVRLAPNHVTVSLPYSQCREHVRQAVESILGQTHRRLTLVVVNDADPEPPWPELAHIDDPRLVRFGLDTNRGRYFADAIVLHAARGPYFAIQDADDWSEPNRLEVLLRALREHHAAAAVDVSGREYAGQRRRPTGRVRSALGHALGVKLEHRHNHHGLFRVEALRRIGGYYGGFRVGYDSLLMSLLMMTAPVVTVDQGLYHWRRRSDSLTEAPATGMRSAYRRDNYGRLQVLYRNALASYQRYLAGELEHEQLLEALCAVTQGRVTTEEREALEAASEQLRIRMAKASGGRTSVLVSSASPAPSPSLERLLGEWDHADDWSLERTTAVELHARLEARRPRRILEAGSGLSTLILAAFAARTGAEVTTLEHDQRWLERTSARLHRHRLAEYVNLVHAPLRPRKWAPGRVYPWYDAELTGPFDFILLDGPPERYGRKAAMYAMRALCDENGWETWLDDGEREHEQACVQEWSQAFDMASRLRPLGSKGVWIIGPELEADPRVDADGLVITVLTGGRPHLLRRTLEGLEAQSPGLLDAAEVVVLLNGHDAETERYLDSLSFVDHRLDHAGPLLQEGEATSRLVSAVSDLRHAEHLLHLEDDWLAATLDLQWLSRARALLREQPQIGQVRLRHHGEPVLDRHMTTGRRIKWIAQEGYRQAASAHFTFNPALVRIGDLSRIYPCRSEADAQRRFSRCGLATAQLVPGVFHHLGDGAESLRSARRRRQRAVTPPQHRSAGSTEEPLSPRPLVSCVMPTCNRRGFVREAIAQFQRQSYEPRELLVVDDGEEPVEDLLPDDPRIRYLRLPQTMRLGAKRNLACEEARGEVIAHWDDDDWMADWRLEYQVEALERSGREACGLSRLLYRDLATGHAWRYTYPPDRRPWLAGGTLCFLKALWRRAPFPNVNSGEDTRFITSSAVGSLLDLEEERFYVATMHAGNTSPKWTKGRRWSPIDAHVVEAAMRAERPRTITLNAGGE